jgi:hypothetical protein
MSWADFYRRRDAINAVLETARREPDRDLAWSDVSDLFATPAELLLALHYSWMLVLTGRLGVNLAKADRDPGMDRVDAVLTAWRATAAQHDALRRILDVHAEEPAMRPAIEGEQRLLALSAGLAELHDSSDEITRVGAALVALARNAPERVAQKRRGPVEQLLRRLVASA